ATVAVIVAATRQDAWAVAPGRLIGGRVRVASGAWTGRRDEVVALELRHDLTNGLATVSLDAIVGPGDRREIVVDDSHEAVARPFAEWLSTVAGLGVGTF